MGNKFTDLKALIKRIIAKKHTDGDLTALRQALTAGRVWIFDWVR